MVKVQLTLEDGTKAEMVATDKVFSSGKTGYFVQGKVTDAKGDRYQTQITMVKIVK